MAFSSQPEDFIVMQSLRQDLIHGIRLMKQKPGFALVTVLTLALGIGANTAIFSILDALVLRNLPVWRPERLVQVAASYRNSSQVPLSFPVFQQLQENQKVFSTLFGWTGGSPYNIEINGALFRSSVRGVTGNYYETLGALPLRGRLIGPQDAGTQGMPVAVIDYELWTRKFARDPTVIGKAIRIEGTTFTIVGVSRKWFTGMTPGTASDITVPITAAPFSSLVQNRAILWIFAAGRLKDGLTIGQAQQQLRSFWREALVIAAPTTSPGERLQSWLGMGLNAISAATGVNADLRLDLQRPLRLLMGMAGLILLVACVNLANLTLARVVARSREISVRVSLGATRWHIIRQLLAETVLLAAAGALFAFILANWGGHLLLAMITAGRDTPVILNLRPDWRVFCFTALAAIGTALLIACMPAWQALHQPPADALRADQRTLAGSSGRLSKWLIVTQIALSLVLVFGAGLLLRSFQTLRALDPHFQTRSVLQVALDARPEGFANVDINSYRKQLVDAVAGLPGVIAAGYADTDIPIGNTGWKDTVVPASLNPADDTRIATIAVVSPGFFETLGIPIVSGRGFGWTDDEKHPRVAIVDSNLARRLLPSGDVLGMHVRFGVQPTLRDLQIVGVARRTRLVSLRDPEAPIIFIPSPQFPDRSDAGNLFVRSQNPAAIVKLVQNEIQSHGHEYSVAARTLQETGDQALVEDRTTALLSTLFAGLALALAGIGLFGLMSYAVSRRTREIGIRIAVGAQQGTILKLILRESVALSFLGIGIGVPFAIAATRLIAHELFGVTASDPTTFLIAAGVVLAVGAVAGYWPARRAAKMDPMAALRLE